MSTLLRGDDVRKNREPVFIERAQLLRNVTFKHAEKISQLAWCDDGHDLFPLHDFSRHFVGVNDDVTSTERQEDRRTA
jgi:hypothetical protein